MARFFGRKMPTPTISVDFTDDTVFAQSFLGSIEEELPERLRAFAASGERGARPFDELRDSRACVLHFVTETLEGGLGMTLPVPQTQLNEVFMLQDALLELADECQAQRTGDIKSAFTEAHWQEWELELLDALFMLLGKAARRVPENFWNRVHCLAMHRIHTKPGKKSPQKVLFNRKYETDLNFIDRYRIMVLLGLANPQQLGEGDAMRTRRIALKVASTVSFTPPGKKDKSKGRGVRFAIDPLIDVPGRLSTEETDDSRSSLMDTTKAVVEVGTSLKRIIDGTPSKADLLPRDDARGVAVLMRHLVTAWGKAPSRRSERIRSGLDVRIQLGFTPVCTLLASVQEEMSSNTDEATRFKLAREHVSQCLGAEVLDESQTGMRLRIKATGIAARKGDLVCVSNDFSSTIQFVPATIRWVETVDAGTFDIGVQKLGKSMAAVQLLPANHSDELEDTISTLMVRSEEGNTKHWRLIAQSKMIKAAQSYSVEVGEKTYVVSNIKAIVDELQIQTFRCDLALKGAAGTQSAPAEESRDTEATV